MLNPGFFSPQPNQAQFFNPSQPGFAPGTPRTTTWAATPWQPATTISWIPSAGAMHLPQLFPQAPMFPGGSFTGAMSGSQFTPNASIFKLPATTTPPVMGGSPFGMMPPTASFPQPTMPMGSMQPQAAPRQDNPLRRSLDLIESDPEGAKLIAAARAKGVFIEVGDAAAAHGSFDMVRQCNCTSCGQQRAFDGGVTISGVTLTDSSGKSRIVVSDPDNIKTIVHELVHATTAQDGNSKEEEGIADVIGSRVANRLGGSSAGGLGGSDQQIFINKQRLYPNLNQTNNVRSTLAGLGLNINV
jgi:hypothetical protein